MTVYKTTRVGRGGVKLERWMIDVTYEYSGGRTERVRRVARIQSKREAEREERELLGQLAAGTYRPARDKRAGATIEVAPEPQAPVLVRDLAARWLDVYVAVNNKPSEAASKESVLRVHLLPAFGDLTLDELTTARIEAYKASKILPKDPLQRKLSAKTVNNHLTVLHKMLATAQEWGELATVPKIRWLKVKEPEIRFLTFQEAHALLLHALPQWRCMILIGMRTGLRLGELIALRWRDVDLEGGRIVVRQSRTRNETTTPKSGRKREVPLSPEAFDALRGRAQGARKGDLVFPAEDGTYLSKGVTKWPLWSSLKQAGLERMGWHVLRHTFASHLVMRGVALKAVQELLGHATIEMTMRYAHLAPDVRRDAVRVLDRSYGTPAALLAG